MKSSILAAILAASLLAVPVAYAQTNYVPIGDPYTDTLQLWSDIATALSFVANGIASVFSDHEFAAATKQPTPTTQQPSSLAAAAATSVEPAQPPTQHVITYTVQPGDTLSSIAQSFSIPLGNLLATNNLSQRAILHPGEQLIIPNPQTAPATPIETASNATSDQTTLSQNVKSAELNPAAPTTNQSATSIFSTPTPAFNASAFVTRNQFNAAMAVLGSSVQQLLAVSRSTPLPQYVAADGNAAVPYAATNNISNLSNVTITNANLTASEIPDLSGIYLSLDGGAVSGTTSFADDVGIGTTSPSDVLAVQGPIFLANVVPTATSNRLYSNGGSLYWNGSLIGGGSVGNWATDGTNVWRAGGNVGIGTTSPGSALSVAGSGYFTSGLVASGNTTLGAATSSTFFSTIGDFTNGVINTLSGTQLSYTAATTTTFANYGTASFGGSATTTIDSAGDLTVAGNTTLHNATSTNFFATTASSTNLFAQTASLGTLSLTGPLSANGATGTSTFAGNISVGGNLNFNGAFLQNGLPFIGSQWTTSGSNIYYTAGNVGIDNTNPSYELDVSTTTSTNVTLARFGNSAGGYYGTIGLDGSGFMVLGSHGSTHTVDIGSNGIGIDGAAGYPFQLSESSAGTFAEIGYSSYYQQLGTNGAGVPWIGTPNSNDYYIETNGTDRLHITSAGNVGIGTTSPATTFSVVGNSYLTGGLGVGLLNTTAGSLQTSGLATFNGGLLSLASSTIGNGNQNGGLTVNGGATTTGTLTIANSATLYTTLSTNSNGYLTINPSGSQMIIGSLTSPANQYINTYSSGQAEFTMYSGGVTTGPFGYYVAGGADGSAYGTFSIGNANTAGAESASLDFDTRSGVAAPFRFFVSAPSAGSVDAMDIFNDTAVQIGTANSEIASTRFAVVGGGNTSSTYAAQFKNSSNTSLLTVRNDGNVGIGTTSPATNLSVSGNGYLTGGLGVGVENTTAGTLQTTGNATLGGNVFIPTGDSYNFGGSNNYISGAGSNMTFTGFSNSTFTFEDIQSGDTLTIKPTTGAFQALEFVGNTPQATTTVIGNSSSNSGGGSNLLVQGGNSLVSPQFGGGNAGSLLLRNGIPTDNSQGHGGTAGYIDLGVYNANSTTTPIDAMRITNTGNIGIGTTNPYSLLQVTGPDTASTTAFAVVNSASTTVFSVFDNGNSTYSGSIFQSSDQRLKTDVTSLDASSSLSAIELLNPVSYLRLDQPGTGENLGFIAQQVQQVFPQLVSTTSATALTPGGTLTLNYEGLISPIVSAIQELDQQLSNLASTVAGFAQSFTSAVGNFGQVNTNDLCVGSTCVTPAQFQAMVATASASQSPGQGTETQSSDDSQATDTPPVIEINGDNPAIIQVGASYNDLGATITGPQQDLNLGISTFVNGVAISPVQIDTSTAATDTIDYVATDQNGLTSTSTRTVIIEAPANDNQAATTPANDNSPPPAATTTAATSTTQ